ncbi:hypothetical protein C0995_012133 [Termitomyces sp. Mi166|nr:hypothetical protein C0995_012133 [Termitomyces sp. Mi166\
MAPKISLLHVSANASLLERERAAQKFIAAADAVFFKAQGLAMLAPLYKTAFGLLKALADSRQMSWKHAISTIEQIKLMHFEKMAIELEPTVPFVAPTTVMNPAPTPVSASPLIQRAPSDSYLADPSSPPMHMTSFGVVALRAEGSLSHISIAKRALFILLIYLLSSSTLSLTQEPPSRWLAPHNKGKGKAKVTENDKDEEEATQKFRKELEDFVVPTTFDDKLLVSLLLLPSEYYKGDIGLPQGAKILGGRKGDITLVSPATRALVLEKNGTCDHCIANNMADHCWYLTGERPCWRCYRKSKGCLWNGIGVRMQKKCLPLSILIMAKHVKLVQAAKAFLKQQGKLSQFFVLEGYKGKGKAKALLGDSE